MCAWFPVVLFHCNLMPLWSTRVVCFAADTKKQEEEELTGLESQEEMESMNPEDLNSVPDEDDDHDSFASLLEHETAGFIREDDKASAPPSTPPSVKTTPTPGKMHASTAVKAQKRIFTIKDCEHITRPAPQHVVNVIKTGTKRAVSAVSVYIYVPACVYVAGEVIGTKLTKPVSSASRSCSMNAIHDKWFSNRRSPF